MYYCAGDSTGPKEYDISKAFPSNRRTEAISRIVDLGLIARETTGQRVIHLVIQLAHDFRADC
jgi:hypothetical protein